LDHDHGGEWFSGGGGKGGAENSFWRLGLSGNQAIFVLRDANGSEVSVTGSSAIADGNWHHLAALRDNSTNQLNLYVDGAQEGSQATAYTGDFSNTGSITIGTFEGSDHFTGRIDEVALHNKTLSDNEIRQHYYDGDVGLRGGYCACGSAIKIMPLGNSITQGIYSATGSAIFPLNELVTGYRQPLYISLTNGYEVDFVGGEQSGQDVSPTFDTDHEGHRGETASQMNGLVTDRLSANPPEVVLLHIGTNGLNADRWTEVEGILDKIDAQSTAIPVILARIIRQHPHNPVTTDFNDNVQTMAQTRIANGDKIIIVDQETALTYPDDMYDDGNSTLYHPNQTGYNKMADVWLGALDDILPICPEALALSLASFSATRQASQILIEWQTIFEIDNLGFHIWRSSSPDAPTERLTKQLLPAQAPGSGQGMSYQWLDERVEEGQTYYYWLEDVDIAGMTTRHGPVSPTMSLPTALTLSTLDRKPRNEANDTLPSERAWRLAIIAFTLLVAAGWHKSKSRASSKVRISS
jgi:hypothetical protein